MQLQLPASSVFQGDSLPPETQLVGWSALVQALAVAAPVRRPSCVSLKHIRGSSRQHGTWRVFDKRYWPGDTLADHLGFALRYETVDPLILKRIFAAVPLSAIETMVRASPGGVYIRRAWYWFETLMGRTLDVADAPRATAVPLVDPKACFAGEGRLSRRHHVRDNMLGNGRFCPVIRRTPALIRFIDQDLAATARRTVGATAAQLVARAASFLLLADSQASFRIEGERPTNHRLHLWNRAVVQAGTRKLTLEEIVRLHDVLIEDKRFTQAGLRTEGVFLGERDRDGNPLPEFIGARPEDLADLMAALLEANDRMSREGLDPVLQAAATAFGFVYVHPFEDGNGRVHRCLVHHVLAERGLSPPNMVFPVSSVMADRIDDYRKTLRAHSGPLMDYVDWEPTPTRNVKVLNDTADLYRYFDCTEAAEFLYACVARTVEHDLPEEIDYLRRYDEAKRRIMEAVAMPDHLIDDLIMLIRQNGGTLSKNRRTGVFERLRDNEVASLEAIVREAFSGFDKAAA